MFFCPHDLLCLYSHIKIQHKYKENGGKNLKDDSNFEVNIFQTLKVTTNESTTLHKTICTPLALEVYDNNDQKFNRHLLH